jgi:hypothetical protein
VAVGAAALPDLGHRLLLRRLRLLCIRHRQRDQGSGKDHRQRAQHELSLSKQ